MSELRKKLLPLVRENQDWFMQAQVEKMSLSERKSAMRNLLIATTNGHDDDASLKVLDYLEAAALEEQSESLAAAQYELLAKEFMAIMKDAPYTQPGTRVVGSGRPGVSGSRTEPVLKLTLEKTRKRVAEVVSKAWALSGNPEFRNQCLTYLVTGGPKRLEPGEEDVPKLNADAFRDTLKDQKFLRKNVGEAYLYVLSLIPADLGEVLSSPNSPHWLLGALKYFWYTRMTGPELEQEIKRGLELGLDESTALDRLLMPLGKDKKP